MHKNVKLHEILDKHTCTLKKASKENNQNDYMTQSKIKVVNFDKLPSEYCKRMKVPDLPCSNDALYITQDDTWYMIEFKNGTIEKLQICQKFYDSVIMLLELGIIPDIQFVREHFVYILVYNSEKYPKEQESGSREQIYNHVRRRAKKEKEIFDVGKFENYLCKEAHTYTKEIFQEKFTEPMEAEELA